MDKIKDFFEKAITFCKKYVLIAYDFCKKYIKIAIAFTVKTAKKIVAWLKTVKWKVVWDHVTTGLLILIMASPLLVLGWIFYWFITR